MRITNTEKLNMCKEHILDKKSLSHISERYGNYFHLHLTFGSQFKREGNTKIRETTN